MTTDEQSIVCVLLAGLITPNSKVEIPTGCWAALFLPPKYLLPDPEKFAPVWKLHRPLPPYQKVCISHSCRDMSALSVASPSFQHNPWRPYNFHPDRELHPLSPHLTLPLVRHERLASIAPSRLSLSALRQESNAAAFEGGGDGRRRWRWLGTSHRDVNRGGCACEVGDVCLPCILRLPRQAHDSVGTGGLARGLAVRMAPSRGGGALPVEQEAVVGFPAGSPGVEGKAQRSVEGLDGVEADRGRRRRTYSSSAPFRHEGDLEARASLNGTGGLIVGDLRLQSEHDI